MKIAEFNQKVQAVKPIDLMQIALEENEPFVIGLNRKQLDAGMTAFGSPIEPFYSIGYALDKSKRSDYNAPFMTPNLKDTGSFQQSMYIKIAGKAYYFTSGDTKANMLRGEYKNIFGLSSDNLKVTKPIVSKSFNKLWMYAVNLL